MSRATLLLATLAVLMLSACSSRALLDRGNAEAAFERAAKRLESSKKASPEQIEVLIDAYAQLQTQGLADLELAPSTEADRFGERTVQLLESLYERRMRMDALRLSVNRVIRVEEWDLEPAYRPLLASAKTRTAGLLLAGAAEELETARLGDRFAARYGVQLLDRRKLYADNTLEISNLREELRDRGTVYVIADVRDLSGWSNERSLGSIFERRLSDDWVRVNSARSNSGGPVDVYADLRVTAVDVAAPITEVLTETYTREVNVRVQVGVDSLCKPIFEDRTEVAKASVISTSIVFAATASGNMRLATPEGESIYRRNLSSTWTVRLVSQEAQGDVRALAGVSINTTGIIAPSQLQLIDSALEKFAQELPGVNVDRELGERRLAAN